MRIDVAVIGRGLLGTACARHLAQAGAAVALVGPDEPALPRQHDGPFGSFHDAGRITRTIAHDPVWARLSLRSIARYAELQAESGIGFFTPRGALIAGPKDGPMAKMAHDVFACAAALGLDHRVMDDARFAHEFPDFDLPRGSIGAFDPLGGVIDPRAMRKAHEIMAVAAGAHVIDDHVTSRNANTVQLSNGDTLSAGHVVLAMGGWSGMPGAGDARLAMSVYQRTVLLVAVDDARVNALAHMPSLIFVPEDRHTDLYVLPPIRYPDGRHYIKIGGEAQSPIATDADGLNDWFKTDGSPTAAAVLRNHLAALMPDLPLATVKTAACAVSFTATGHPYVGRLDDATTVLTGGNGAAAKCADELGRLGAVAALGGDVTAEGIGAELAPVCL